MIRRKRGEFGFVWFFAIIAGIAILLLSIYAAMKLGKTLEIENEATIAKKLTILTDPLEAGFTSATFGTIKFQRKTEIYLYCDEGGFGYNSIRAKTKSDIQTARSEFTVPVSTSEKYIYGLEEDAGENFYILSKAFNFPFKIADYVILISDSRHYCIKDAPEDFREELSSLRIPVIEFDNCSRRDDTVMVCFGSSNCDISITGNCQSCQDLYETGVVRYEGNEREYVGNLIYPAIFASTSNYRCNTNRLLYRGSTVTKILARKAELMNVRDCSTNMYGPLSAWSQKLDGATYKDMAEMYSDALAMEEANKWEVCNVW